MKQPNKFIQWYKNLTKKKKIAFFLWIFVPLFIVILVASLLGTTLSNYYKDFSLDKNKTSAPISKAFNDVFSENKTTKQYSLNYSEIANLLVANAINRDFSQGKNPSDWTTYLEDNDFIIYLQLVTYSSVQENIQLIYKTSQMNTSSNAMGIYNSASATENKSEGNKLNNNSNLPEAYNYEYISLSQQFLFDEANDFSMTLMITQIQQPNHQYPDMEIDLTY